MKILVTGANGFIGRSLSIRLISCGHQVWGLSLKSLSDTSLSFKDYYQQDISTPFSLNDPFDLVIHLAAYNITNIGAKDLGLYRAINIEGTKNLLQAVQTKKFIYLSTTKIYKNEGLPITESSPLNPLGAYEQSKLEAEEVCRSFFKKEALVILRSANVLGWGQAAKAVVPVFFEKARANQALEIINGAQAPMQYVYLEDLIDAMELVFNNNIINGIFNIAHEAAVNLEQMAKSIIALTHSSSEIKVAMKSSRVVFSPVICEKAYQQLGWKAKTDFKKIIEYYEEAYAKHQ